jgi:hypothetical protein
MSQARKSNLKELIQNYNFDGNGHKNAGAKNFAN